MPSAILPPSWEIRDVAMLRGSSVLASSWDQHVLDQQRGSFVMPIYKQKDFQSCQGLELCLASILCLQPPGYSLAAGSRENTLKHPGKFGDAARMEAAWVEQVCVCVLLSSTKMGCVCSSPALVAKGRF